MCSTTRISEGRRIAREPLSRAETPPASRAISAARRGLRPAPGADLVPDHACARAGAGVYEYRGERAPPVARPASTSTTGSFKGGVDAMFRPALFTGQGQRTLHPRVTHVCGTK